MTPKDFLLALLIEAWERLPTDQGTPRWALFF